MPYSFGTPWTLASVYRGQAPLSMDFFRQDYWSGLPFPSGDLPDPGIELGRFFTTEPPGKPRLVILILHNFSACMIFPLLEWEQKVGCVLYITIFLIWRVGVIWWSWKGRLLTLQKSVCFELSLSNGGNVFKFINIFLPSPNAYHGAKSTDCGLGTEQS